MHWNTKILILIDFYSIQKLLYKQLLQAKEFLTYK